MSGSMELFYIPNVTGDHVVLENEQFKHAIKAMRKRQGDAIQFTDGQGVIYDGTIQEIERRSATVHIQHRMEAVPSEYHVTICVSLTKNIKRIEWALEKIAEIGISRITPLICHRSERTTFNRDRLTKILVSAMKQSQQSFLPVLDEPMTFKDVIAGFNEINQSDNSDQSNINTQSDNSDQSNISTQSDESNISTQSDESNISDQSDDSNIIHKYIAHKSPTSISLKHNYTRGSDVVILIGPEGDFTDEELDLAGKANFTPLSLGHNRLRTETAAVVAVASVHAMNH
jgi:16S rRNA (uracil1498-N3)-methyltransferase